MTGFYKLASGLITQNRRLTAVSNNIANVNTPGYKKESVSAATFGNLLVQRTADAQVIGNTSLMTVADGLDVTATQGILEQTGNNLHFAIGGEGFFAVQTPQGMLFTRNGSFSLDEEGYLTLPGAGRVLGAGGNPLQPGTDEFEVSGEGVIWVGGYPVGQLAVYQVDADALMPAGNGLYQAQGAQLMLGADVRWQTLEHSNVTAVEEMTAALSIQRQLQTVAQALRIYDQIQTKSNEIGKVL